LEAVPEKTGILAGWTGPRYFEQDDWFDSRKNFLDALESQLKGLSKSIESASKARLELAVQMGDYAISMTDLGESDLGSAMCAALARLSDLAKREKEVHEEQAKGDVMTLLNMSDEYVRFIGSVRLAFAARIKAYHHWQNMEKEVGRMKATREKLRQQGRLGDRVNSSLGEINEVSALTDVDLLRSLMIRSREEFETLRSILKISPNSSNLNSSDSNVNE
jgi:sorting nexin-1/2